MQPHDQLQEKILPYVARRLEADAAREFEVHLATCEECQELVACCEEIAAGVREEAGVAEASHPDPLRLREHVLDSRTDERIAAHLGHCVSCALEVASWKRNAPAVVAEPARAAPSVPPFSWFAWRPLVIGAAFGAVVVMGVFLTLQGPDSPTSRPSWSGTAETLLLREPLRGSAAGDAPSIRVAPGQSVIPLEVELSVPFDAPPSGRYTFEVQTDDGSTTLRLEATAEKVRSQLRQSGTFKLFLDTGSHPPGSYTIEIRNGESMSRKQTFDVER